MLHIILTANSCFQYWLACALHYHTLHQTLEHLIQTLKHIFDCKHPTGTKRCSSYEHNFFVQLQGYSREHLQLSTLYTSLLAVRRCLGIVLGQ
jgi:hypothetical protein